LCENLLLVAQVVVQRGGHRIIEWPVSCRYWREPRVADLPAISQLGWTDMRAKACAHAQRISVGIHEGKAFAKTWRLLSTMVGPKEAAEIPCLNDHEHVRTEGGTLALLSGRYS